jgi:hypothetical protein
MPNKNNDIIPKELTPEEIALEAQMQEEYRLRKEAEDLAKKLKKENIERLYAKLDSKDDLVAMFNEAGVVATNHRKYLEDLVYAENESALDAILSKKQVVNDKFQEEDKQSKVEELLAQIPYHMLDAQTLAHAKVVKYFQKKGQLVNKLKQKLGL